MNEKDLDSSMNSYQEEQKPKGYITQLQWDMAIGLQQVDNLKPSKYLEQISEKNILGELTIKEVEQSLREYYTTKEQQKDINHKELECDFVSMRIVELLNQDNFELSVDYLKYIHKYLFQDVYEFAGEFRKLDFSKHEKILNNDTVAYGDSKTLNESLEYDISLEKEKNYKEMSIVEVIKNINVYGEFHRYIPVLAKKYGFKITEISVLHHKRQYGVSKFGFERYLRGFFDAFSVLFLQRYYDKPMYFFGMLGFVFGFWGFVICAYLTLLWLMGEAIGHRPLLFMGVLFILVGVQFFSMGLIGNMITDANERKQPKDAFVKKTVLGEKHEKK